MNINSNTSMVQRISKLKESELGDLDLAMYLVRKQFHSDSYYMSSEVVLDNEVIVWLKRRIVESLIELKQSNEVGNDEFVVADYNYEVERTDYIARFDVNVDEDLLKKKNKLINSFNEPSNDYKDQTTNFQIIKLKYEEEIIFFCFYRGTKKNTKRKKMAIRNSNKFNFFDETIVDVGGYIDFFFTGDYIFIMNNTSFEHAFNYRDHVNLKRDKVLSEIVSMPFFNHEESNGAMFKEKCSTYIYSRSLAQVTDDTLESLQINFESRCDELQRIKDRLPEDDKEREIYKEKLGSIWLLMDYIDTENYKVIFKEEFKPTPLIHFFADKIVKSFLTEDIKLALAYQ